MATVMETKITKDQFIPFLDTAKDMTYTNSTWKRICKSTVFELTMGEQTEDYDYICYPAPVTEVNANKPELPQETTLVEGDALYDFVLQEFYKMPVGEACKVPFLICFGGTGKLAWRGVCTLTSKVLNTVDGKITFSMMMGGEIQKGKYTITAGVPTFTPASGG